MYKPVDLVRRAKRIYRTEGLASLAGRTWAFVVRRFMEYQTYYLFEHRTDEIANLAEVNLVPEIDGLSFSILTTNQEADALEDNGFEFRSSILNAKERLDKGGVALCMFIGCELASIGWVAFSRQSQSAIGEPPYHVDFSGGEVSAGGVWTNPRFRGLGLNKYGHYKRSQFKVSRGKVISRSAIAPKNVVSQRSYAGPSSPRIYAQGCYLKILWWKSWREKQLLKS